MPTVFPGATYRPMPGSEQRPQRRKGRGVGYHVAVHRGPSIYDINLGTGNDAHLYVRMDGTVEQNVDLDVQAWAGRDGNTSMIWVETEGGADPATVETETWTDAQTATLAAIARWAHATEGVPLQVMPDSKPTSKGVGTHRLGIDPYRVAGGELWSSDYAKACPGSAKVAQIPHIVSLALTPEDDMPLTDADIEKVAQRTRAVIADGTLPYGLDNLRRKLDALSAQVVAADANDAPDVLVAAILKALPAPASGGLTEADVETALRTVLGSLKPAT